MRVFIAIDIDKEIRKSLNDLQQQIAADAGVKKSDVKWVSPQAIHLTLKFLGEVADERIIEVCNAVGEVAGRHKSFELDVESVGYFGGNSARVLWVGMSKGKDDLLQLQQDLEQRMVSVGWPQESREFEGHLTLCRIRNSRAGLRLAQISRDYKDFKLGTISADSLSVYESRLTPDGPVYTRLGNYKLNES